MTGVKQGCPFSPILFNLTIQGLLLGLDETDAGYELSDGSRIKYLAYADKLCILANDKFDIQQMISRMEEFTKRSNLQFNTSKCASLSCINSKSTKYVESFSPKLMSEYKYLGVQTGRTNLSSLTDLKSILLKESEIIAKSLLSDWQKIEAINIFVLSKAQYHLRASTPYRTWAQSIDKQIRKILKQSLKLPKRTTTSFLYTANRHRGVGLQSLEDDLDIDRVIHFFKCLISPDQTVSQCAWVQLNQVISKRTNNKNPTPEDIASFLNTPPPPRETTKCDDVQHMVHCEEITSEIQPI